VGGRLAAALYPWAFRFGAVLALASWTGGAAAFLATRGRLPGLTQSALVEAESALAKGDAPKAIREYRQAVAVSAGDFQLLLGAGEGLARAGDLEGATEAFGKARALRPRSTALQTSLGWALFWRRRFDEALAQFEEVLRSDPLSARAYAGVGEVRLEQDRYAEARAALEKAIAIDPTDPTAHNNLGITYALSGQPQKAVEHFAIAARLSPGPEFSANLSRAQAALEAAGRESGR
jgi:Flp pilus assembly protein TadD